MTKAALSLAVAAALGAGSAAALEVDEARHILGRTGFAATPSAVEALLPLDREAAVQFVLDGAATTASLAPPEWTQSWQAPGRLRDLSVDERRAVLRQRRERMLELKAWWFREMISTPTPITEVMTLFWHNHFTSSQRKVRSEVLMYRQNELLRRHALGNFGDLLRDIGRDPAMVIYLDNFANRKDAPNENYARELLELFTFGEGHYGETDIKEIARAFTGWTVRRRSGEFIAARRQHDDGVKTILGESGRFDGDDVVDILLQQPRTAEFIVEKLWRTFVSDTVEPAEVARLAHIFRGADYDLKPLLAALFTSDAFWAPEARGALIRSPVELLVGTVRLFDLPVTDARMLAQASRRLGQDLFFPPNVKGWPGGAAWITTDTYLQRQSLLRLITRPGDANLGGARPRRGRAVARMGAEMGAGIDDWQAALPARWRDAETLHALLVPLPPADVQVLDSMGDGALVRALVNDPVYQLK